MFPQIAVRADRRQNAVFPGCTITPQVLVCRGPGLAVAGNLDGDWAPAREAARKMSKGGGMINIGSLLGESVPQRVLRSRPGIARGGTRHFMLVPARANPDWGQERCSAKRVRWWGEAVAGSISRRELGTALWTVGTATACFDLTER